VTRFLQPAVAAYGTAFNAYLAEALGVHTDQPLPRAAPTTSRSNGNWQGERQHGTEGPWRLSSLEAALLEHPADKGYDRQTGATTW